MPLVLPLVDGRVVVVLVLVPVRPLVPAVGRLPVTVGLVVVDGRVVVVPLGRVVVPAELQAEQQPELPAGLEELLVLRN